MARTAPHVISTRLNDRQLETIRLAADRKGYNLSRFAVIALESAAKGDNSDAVLSTIRDALKLPSDATPDQVKEAVIQFFADLALGEPPPSDNAAGGLAESADPPPPPALLSQAALSPLAFPTTPAQQKQWVADRAAQRAKRRR